MAAVEEVLSYLRSKCGKNTKNPSCSDLLDKLVYLADWRSAITRGRQLTDLHWRYSRYEPRSEELTRFLRAKQVKDSPLARFRDCLAARLLTRHPVGTDDRKLSRDEQRILDYVVESVRKLDRKQINRLVHSTYPVITQQDKAALDLVALAREYELCRDLLDSNT